MALSITSVSPSTWYTNGGGIITVYGHFDNNTLQLRIGADGAWVDDLVVTMPPVGDHYAWFLIPARQAIGTYTVYVRDTTSSDEDSIENGFTYTYPGNLHELFNRRARMDDATFIDTHWGYGYEFFEGGDPIHYAWMPQTVCWTDVHTGHEAWRVTSGPSNQAFTKRHLCLNSTEYSSNYWSNDGAAMFFYETWARRRTANTTILHSTNPDSDHRISWYVRTDGSWLRVGEGPHHQSTSEGGRGWTPSHPLVDSERSFWACGRSKLTGSTGVSRLQKGVLDDENVIAHTVLKDLYSSTGEPTHSLQAHSQANTTEMWIPKGGIKVDPSTGLNRYALLLGPLLTWPSGDQRPSHLTSRGVMLYDSEGSPYKLLAWHSCWRRIHNLEQTFSGTCQYYLSNVDCTDLTGGADFNKRLRIWDEAEPGVHSIEVTVAGSATETSYGFTAANRPAYSGWEQGAWKILVYVTAANANLKLNVGVTQVSPAGAVVAGPFWGTEQTLSATGAYTFEPSATWVLDEWSGTADYTIGSNVVQNPSPAVTEDDENRYVGHYILISSSVPPTVKKITGIDHIAQTITMDSNWTSTSRTAYATKMRAGDRLRVDYRFVNSSGSSQSATIELASRRTKIEAKYCSDRMEAEQDIEGTTHDAGFATNQWHGGSAFALGPTNDSWMFFRAEGPAWFRYKVIGTDVDGGPKWEEWDGSDYGNGEIRPFSMEKTKQNHPDAYSSVPFHHDHVCHGYFQHPQVDRWGKYIFWGSALEDTDAGVIEGGYVTDLDTGYGWDVDNVWTGTGKVTNGSSLVEELSPALTETDKTRYEGHHLYAANGGIRKINTIDYTANTITLNGNWFGPSGSGLSLELRRDGSIGENTITDLSVADGGHRAWDAWADDVVFGPYHIGHERLMPFQCAYGAHLNFDTKTLGDLYEIGCFHGIFYDSVGHCPSYEMNPRPGQSPDGTKVAFHTAVFSHYATASSSSSGNTDICWIVAYKPKPPVMSQAIKEGGEQYRLHWTSPKYSTRPWPLGASGAPEPREIKYYHVWSSVTGWTGSGDTDWVELTTTGVPFTGGSSDYFDVSGAWHPTPSAGQTSSRYYAVTSEEHSRLESDKLSNIWKVTLNDAGQITVNEQHYAEGLQTWWVTAPPVVTSLTATRPAAETRPAHYDIVFTEPSGSKVRYYDIMARDGAAPTDSAIYRIASIPVGSMTRHTKWLDWCGNTSGTTQYGVVTVDRYGRRSSIVTTGEAPTSITIGETARVSDTWDIRLVAQFPIGETARVSDTWSLEQIFGLSEGEVARVSDTWDIRRVAGLPIAETARVSEAWVIQLTEAPTPSYIQIIETSLVADAWDLRRTTALPIDETARVSDTWDIRYLPALSVDETAQVSDGWVFQLLRYGSLTIAETARVADTWDLRLVRTLAISELAVLWDIWDLRLIRALAIDETARASDTWDIRRTTVLPIDEVGRVSDTWAFVLTESPPSTPLAILEEARVADTWDLRIVSGLPIYETARATDTWDIRLLARMSLAEIARVSDTWTIARVPEASTVAEVLIVSSHIHRTFSVIGHTH